MSSPERILVESIKHEGSLNAKAELLEKAVDSFAVPGSSERWIDFKSASILDMLHGLSHAPVVDSDPGVILHLAVLSYLKKAISVYQTEIILDNDSSALLKANMVAAFHRSRHYTTTPPSFNPRLVPLIAVSTIGLLGSWLPFLDDHQHLMEALNREHVLELLFQVHFDPSCSREAIVTKACLPIWATYALSEDYENEASSRAFFRYGPEEIVSRCLDAFENDVWNDLVIQLAFGQMFLFVHGAQQLHEAFANAGLHVALVRRYWRWLRSEFRPSEDMVLFAREITKILAIMLRRLSEDQPFIRSKIVAEVVEQDLIAILGRTLVGERLSIDATAGNLMLIGEYIADASVSDPNTLWEQVEPAWRHALECVLDLARAPVNTHTAVSVGQLGPHGSPPHVTIPDYTPAVIVWRKLGDILGIEDHLAVPKDEVDTVQITLDCSWMKCPLFRDVVIAKQRKMLRCSRCKSVQYCGVPCQRMDWHEGGHRIKCKARR